ncbi:MAG: hypothetical protein ABI986_02030 [Chloroflexota bacterium]
MGGLSRFDGITMRTFDYKELSLSGFSVMSMLDDCTFLVPEGVIKVNNDKASLFTWNSYHLPTQSFTSTVNSITLAPDNSIWFATFEGALRLSEEIVPKVAFTGCN